MLVCGTVCLSLCTSECVCFVPLCPCVPQTVVPAVSAVSFVVTMVVSVTCANCTWVIYSALAFAITVGILILARLQLLATSSNAAGHTLAVAVAFPELAPTLSLQAREQERLKRKDLHLPVRVPVLL